MTYSLRNFQNNLQTISSLGWVLVVISIVFTFMKGPGALVIGAVGGILIVWQQRGKRIKVDTKSKTIRKGMKSVIISNPQKIFINRVNISQSVNSRVSTTNVKSYFYTDFYLSKDAKWV